MYPNIAISNIFWLDIYCFWCLLTLISCCEIQTSEVFHHGHLVAPINYYIQRTLANDVFGKPAQNVKVCRLANEKALLLRVHTEEFFWEAIHKSTTNLACCFCKLSATMLIKSLWEGGESRWATAFQQDAQSTAMMSTSSSWTVHSWQWTAFCDPCEKGAECTFITNCSYNFKKQTGGVCLWSAHTVATRATRQAAEVSSNNCSSWCHCSCRMMQG